MMKQYSDAHLKQKILQFSSNMLKWNRPILITENDRVISYLHLTINLKAIQFVLFRFVQHMSKKAVIIRKRIQHTGHDLKNLQEKHLSKPDPALCQYIDALLEQVRFINNIKDKYRFCQ